MTLEEIRGLEDRIQVGRGNFLDLGADGILHLPRPHLCSRRGFSGALHRAAGRSLREVLEAAPSETPGLWTPGFRIPEAEIYHLNFGPAGISAHEVRLRVQATFDELETRPLRRLVCPYPPFLGSEESAFQAFLDQVLQELEGRRSPGTWIFCCFQEAEKVRIEAELLRRLEAAC